MSYKKLFILFAVLILGTTLIFWQLVLAGPPEKLGNPGLPGCLAEVDELQGQIVAKDTEIADLQGQIAIKDAEIEELNEQLDELQSQPPAPVPQTGQTELYYPGDDGDLQRGIPCPEPRFADNGDGTVTDNCTGLIWLQNANCLATNHPGFDNDDIAGDGRVTWQHALDFVAGINNGTYGECGASYTDWRLPNIKELLSLVDLGFNDPAIADTSPFTNVQSFYYWSSSSLINPTPGYERWFVLFLNGSAHGYFDAFPALVWPVRGGN